MRRRLPADIARLSDGLLDFAVLAFAAWTVIYHVCLVLHVDAMWAGIAQAVALVPCAWLAFGRNGPEQGASDPAPAPGSVGSAWPRRTVLAAAHVSAAVIAATLFAFTGAPWQAVWLLWMLAAGAALVIAARGDRPLVPSPDRAGVTLPAAAVALLWAVVLAVNSLFLVRSAEDDTRYVQLSTWIAEHGVFPLRDTLFSNQVFPAIIYPPVSSFEALVGTFARATGLAAPSLVYLVVGPLAAALSVLAVWRLLRSWRVPMVGVALTVAMVFLLMDAPVHRALGNTLVTRTWHGKVILAAVLLPLLFVLLNEYVERPTRRRVVLLAAAGAAGVGLSSTGVFLVPVVALGCLVAIAPRAPRRATAALLATIAYPVGAGIVILAVGGRTAAPNPYWAPGDLVRYVLDDGLPAFVAIAAVLIAPVLIPRAQAARMAATTVLLVGCLFTAPVLLAAFHVLDLGRVLWRLLWVLPAAALVGTLAVGVAARFRSPAARALPPVLLCGALVLGGVSIWAAPGVWLATSPSWKRPPATMPAARSILAESRPGDTILAPTLTSQTIVIMSGRVTTVAPRAFYARALKDVPEAHARARVHLQAFADSGFAAPVFRATRRVEDTEDVVRWLRRIGVDLACVENEEALRALRVAGYTPVTTAGSLVCMRAPPGGSSGQS